jgi:hypothetical protein
MLELSQPVQLHESLVCCAMKRCNLRSIKLCTLVVRALRYSSTLGIAPHSCVFTWHSLCALCITWLCTLSHISLPVLHALILNATVFDVFALIWICVHFAIITHFAYHCILWLCTLSHISSPVLHILALNTTYVKVYIYMYVTVTIVCALR